MAANIFERKYIELQAAHPYIKSVARPGAPIARLANFTYNVTIGSAATPLTLANGSINQVLTTQSDSDFVFDEMSAGFTAVANGDLMFNRNLTLQIQDLSTGKLFFGAPALIGLVAGAGGFPFKFSSPRVIRANASVQFTGRNLDTITNFFQMKVALHGTKIFYEGR